MEWYHVCELDWPVNASRGLSAIAEFLVKSSSRQKYIKSLQLRTEYNNKTGLAGYQDFLYLWKLSVVFSSWSPIRFFL